MAQPAPSAAYMNIHGAHLSLKRRARNSAANAPPTIAAAIYQNSAI